jgi:hypothetical protein
MAFVLAMAAALWGLGHVMKTPVRARFVMLGVLYVAVLAVQIALPEGNGLRQATGGSLGEWLFVGMLVGVVLVYRGGLGWLRARAGRAEAGRAVAQAPQRGPFSDAELERYARHITLREIGGQGQRALKEARVLVVVRLSMAFLTASRIWVRTWLAITGLPVAAARSRCRRRTRHRGWCR